MNTIYHFFDTPFSEFEKFQQMPINITTHIQKPKKLKRLQHTYKF